MRRRMWWHRIRGHRIVYGEDVFVYGSHPVAWCSCGQEWDDRHPSCPVCADKATKRAAARVGLMQAVFGGRG